MTGAGIVFFAYIGFDAVSTAAQEAKNPQRDMPIGIIGSLLICTVLYILVSAIATGVVPYTQLDVPDPIAVAADRAGMGWMGKLIKLGAIAGLSSVILVMLLGQSRVFYSMSRDGLLPPFVSRVHPRFRTPWITSIVTGLGVAFFSAVFTVREAGSLCSIGTLLAFVIVSVGVLVLRVREPNLPRRFTTPAVWFVAPAGRASALYLMSACPGPPGCADRLVCIGMVVYSATASVTPNSTRPGLPGLNRQIERERAPLARLGLHANSENPDPWQIHRPSTGPNPRRVDKALTKKNGSKFGGKTSGGMLHPLCLPLSEKPTWPTAPGRRIKDPGKEDNNPVRTEISPAPEIASAALRSRFTSIRWIKSWDPGTPAGKSGARSHRTLTSSKNRSLNNYPFLSQARAH